jgi:hypothetical protein
MGILLYVETRNNEIESNEPLGSFKTDDERDVVVQNEIELCISNYATEGVINALKNWDKKSTLSYLYDSRTRRYGNWIIVE